MMKKILTGVILGVAILGLSSCATDGTSRSNASSYSNSGIDGLNGYSRFGKSSLGYSSYGYSRFGYDGGLRGSSRFGGRRSYGGFGYGTYGRGGRLGGFSSYGGNRGFGRRY